MPPYRVILFGGKEASSTATTWISLEEDATRKQPETKNHILRDSMCTKRQEETALWR